MALSDITLEAVFSAIEEYDRLGERAFFDKYGFEAATKFWLLHGGKRYASKAVGNVAQAIGMNRPYHDDIKLGGGERIVSRLRTLGFVVEAPTRNPTWNRDELILALDLYFTNPSNPPSKESAAVAELSSILNKLHRLNGAAGSETLRNPNGVYLKMMNLRALDPGFTAQGKVGMTSGGKLEKVIWDEYEGKRSDLSGDAAAIRHAIAVANEETAVSVTHPDHYEAEEGGVILRLHRSYERDRRLVAEKKKLAKAAGKLTCEVCGFDFEERYGILGAEYIEVHHIKPVHAMGPGAKTTLGDLVLLCSNCHRMAHRKRMPLSLNELRDAYRSPLP